MVQACSKLCHALAAACVKMMAALCRKFVRNLFASNTKVLFLMFFNKGQVQWSSLQQMTVTGQKGSLYRSGRLPSRYPSPSIGAQSFL